MKSVFKKSLAVVLTVVMLFSVLSVTAFATDEVSDYPAITLGQEQVVNIETKGDEKFFVYIPEKTGGYIFESFAEKPKDTFGTVYNSNMKRLFSNDEDGIDSNFRIMIKLTAGETYYFSVRFYDDELGEIPFKLSSIDSSVLELKKEAEVEIATQGQETYFEYTPTVTETYIFKSISNNIDTVATVYNSNFSVIAYNDDSAMDNNFYVEVTLKAGETYYFAVSLYNSSSILNFSVLLTMVESPFESIQINPITLTEGVDGYYNEYWDESSGEKIKYFEYDWPNYISYTVKLKNGQEIKGEGYSFKYQNRVYNFSFNDNQTPYNPWKPDNTYTVKISVEKLSDEMEISIVHNYQDANCTTPQKCEACGETLGDALGHTYDNDCDTICNICNQERTITHDFRWVIDEMNNCGKEGKQHQVCSGCGIVQNENTPIPATNSHAYVNDCDTDCDVCGFVREVDNHMYNSVVDKTCDICGVERQVIGQHLIEEGDKIYYYVDGEKSDITDLVKINGVWYYISNGVWDTSVDTLHKINGKWFLIKGGIWKATTGLEEYKGKTFYVVGGKWNSDVTDLKNVDGKWYYIQYGKWNNTIDTLHKINGKWFLIKKGMWNKTTGLVEHQGKTFLVKGGKWDSSVNTLYKKGTKLYAIKSGKVYTSKVIISYNGKKYYCNKGYAQTSFSGKVKISGKTYTVKKGIVK